MITEIIKNNQMQDFDYVMGKNIISNIFDLFNEVKLENDKIAIPIITDDGRVRYKDFIYVDSTKIKEGVLKDLILGKKIQDNRRTLLPRTTSNYELRPEQYNPSYKSPVEECIFINSMLEIELIDIQELFSQLKISLRKLTKEELEVFNLTFYKHKNEDEIATTMKQDCKKNYEIRKSTFCIISKNNLIYYSIFT